MNEPKRYEIKTLKDFMSVPDDRLDECLVGFRQCLGLWNITQASGIASPRGDFTWVDDGKRDVTIRPCINGDVIGEIKLT